MWIAWWGCGAREGVGSRNQCMQDQLEKSPRRERPTTQDVLRGWQRSNPCRLMDLLGEVRWLIFILNIIDITKYNIEYISYFKII